jgi:hypothetical protein
MRKSNAVRVHAMKAYISTDSHVGRCLNVSGVLHVEVTLYQRRPSLRHPLNSRSDGPQSRSGRFEVDRNPFPCWKTNQDSTVVQSVLQLLRRLRDPGSCQVREVSDSNLAP